MFYFPNVGILPDRCPSASGFVDISTVQPARKGDRAVKKFMKVLVLALLVGSFAEKLSTTTAKLGGDPPPICDPGDPSCGPPLA